MYNTIELEKKEKSIWIILSREERRNALNPEMLKDLNDALSSVNEDDDVVSIVLTGAGEKAFCSGMDLGGAAAQLSPLERYEMQREFIKVLKTIKASNKPIVARVQGLALGGGFGLLSACDLVIASDNVKGGTPEINLGLFPYIIMASLIRTTNNQKALLEMMFTGEKITAYKMQELGFVNYVVKAKELDAKVAEVTEKINKKSPAILRLGRRAYYTIRDMEYEKAMDHLSAMLAVNSQAEDMIEGVMAFMEKREPEWKGK